MEAKVRGKAEDLFNNETAKDYYRFLINDSDVYEYGLDSNGKIYFAYLNGVINRFTRYQFLKAAKGFYSFQNNIGMNKK